MQTKRALDADTKRDLICSAATLAFSAFLLVGGRNIRSVVKTTLGSDFMPKLIAVVLALLGAVLLLQTLRRRSRGGGAEAEAPSPIERRRLTLGEIFENHADLLSIAVLLFYVFSMKSLGFILSSMIFLVLQMLVLSTRKHRRLWLIVAVSLVSPALIYFIFTRAFSLVLPAGILSF